MDLSRKNNTPSLPVEWGLLSLCSVLVFFLYGNTLTGEFLFDDLRLIPNNPAIRLQELTLGGLAKAAFTTRPVAMVSFALNYYFHQYAVAGYHVVNILIHIATGIFLYFFIKSTINLPSLKDRYGHNRYLALVVALVWMVNPLHTQTVSYIVQRMNGLAAMFYILSMLCYVQARIADGQPVKRTLLSACCGLSALFALGSKEIAATLPFFILLYEWFFFQEMSRKWLRTASFILAAILVATGALFFLFPQFLPAGILTKGYEPYPFTMGQRLLTESRVVMLYLGLLFFPHPSRLNLDYDFPVSYSLFQPSTTFLSILCILSLILVAVCIASREPLLSYCILWFFGNLVIESTVIPLDLVFEQRTYLPSMLVILLVVLLVERFWRVYPLPKLIAFFLVVAVCSFWTVERNRDWSNALTMMIDNAEKSPDKARPAYNVACEFAKAGKVHEALVWLERAVGKDDFNRWDLIRYDKDLDGIRATREFADFYQKVVPLEKK
ncbi:MAG: hypothetical protein V1706_06585 [Pseudomonadota bacterium]